jgi:uncharacterized protein (TIGR02646 family)
MVRIDKSKVGIPAILGEGGKGESATQELIQHYEAGKRDFKSTDFASEIYGHKTVKSLLMKVQSKKCCFCERKRPHAREGDVEHFRPKTGFRIKSKSALIKPGYYWLAYDFSNLFYACKVCNQEYKKNFFPIADETLRARSHQGNWMLEEALIIHLEFDNPADHIEFLAEVAKPKAGSFKGKNTIKLVGLNNSELLKERFTLFSVLKILAKEAHQGNIEAKKYFKKISRKGHQFSLMVRCNFPDLV